MFEVDRLHPKFCSSSTRNKNPPGVLLPSRLVHKAPLESRGEAGSATATEARVLDGLDDPGVTLVDDVLGAVPISTRLEKG
jgi:hypothetical protein